MRVLEESEECCRMCDALHCLNNRHYTLRVFFLLSLKLNVTAQIKYITQQPRMMSEGYQQETLFTRHLISSFLCLLCCRPLYLSLRLPLLQSTWFVLYLLRKYRLNLNKARLHERRMLFVRWIFLDIRMNNNPIKLYKRISGNNFYGSRPFMVSKW